MMFPQFIQTFQTARQQGAREVSRTTRTPACRTRNWTRAAGAA